MRSALLVAVFALLAVPARAQTNDLRWEPWLGCWNLAVDNLRPREAPEDVAGRAVRRPATAVDAGPRVCVSRTPDGARFETTVGPQTAIDQTIVADAAAHPVNDGECSGTQRSEWSKSGLRLYSSAEIRCRGDDGLRKVSGLSLIAPNGDWLDIQAVTIGERETVRVKRYNRAADSPRPSRPDVAGSRLTFDEVKEAGSRVSSGALEAALIETLAGFDLSGKKVMELASAGVPEPVIDLLVALSYPDKFVIQRLAQVSPSGQTTFARDPFMIGPFATPFFYDGYYYGSPYFYEPFGYRGYSFFGYGPTFVVEGVEGGGRPIGSASGTGRVVNGMGYTRVTTRPDAGSSSEPPARAASRSSGSSSAPRDSSSSSSSSGSSSSGSSSSGSSSSGSSGGGSVTPSGASSGSGSSDSGRTAVPR
jgi:hypothetical protein